MATETAPKLRHRRWPWIVGGIIGGLLLLIVLLVSAVLLLLGTAADRALVARKALEIANTQLAGRIELKSAWLFPNGHFIAHDVTIRGPDGQIIVRAATVETHVDFGALPKKRLHFTHTTVTGAGLFLVVDAKGNLNIADAFMLKHPSPPAAASDDSGPGIAVDVDGADVAVEEANLRVLPEGPPTVPPAMPPTVSPLADLRDIQLHGSFSLTKSGTISIQADSLQARALAPLEGPLALHATLAIVGPELQAAAGVRFDDAQLQAQADLNLVTLNGKGTLSDGAIGPHLLERWLPGLDAHGAHVSASVALKGKSLQLVSLLVSQLEGNGKLTANGRLELGDGTAEVHLVAADLDARALFGKLPTSTLGFRLDANGEALFRANRRFSGHLAIGPSVIQLQHVGPGELDASLAEGTLSFDHVSIAFPGGRVRGAGKLSGEGFADIDAQAQIEASDLAAFRAALQGISGVHLPELAGRFSSQVAIGGRLPSPALRADVEAPHLELNGIQADAVEANLDAARLGARMDLQGTLSIAALRLADRTLHDVGGSVGWTTPNLHLDLKAEQGGDPLGLVADLLLPEDLQSATLSALTLHIGGGDWLLAQPATLDFHAGVALDHLELRSEPQRLSVSLRVTPHALSGSAQVEALDLAHLPATLLPALKLSGVLEGQARYEEQDGKRAGSADLTLSQVAFSGLTIPSGHVQAALNGQQLSGSLAAKLGHGEISLSASGPLPKVAGKLDAELEANQIVLDDFAGVVPDLASLHGKLSLEAHIGGTWAAPQIALTASARDVTGDWTRDPQAGLLAKPLALSLSVTLDPSGLKQDLQLQAGTSTFLSLTGAAPFPSHRLVEGLGDPRRLVAEVLALPLDEQLTLTNLPLEPVVRLLPGQLVLEGVVSAKGRIRGTVRAPRGELSLAGRGLSYAHRPLGDLDLQASAGDRGFTGQIDLKPAQGQLTATLDWSIPPEQLAQAKARLAARLTGDLKVTSVPLATALGEHAALQGLVELSAAFRGSLSEPSAHAEVSVHDLVLQQVAAGKLDAQAQWSGTQLVVTLDGQQPQGGHLEAHAQIPLALQGGVGTQRLSAKLDAQGFDLAPFSAIAAQGGTLRALGGRLDAKLSVGGTLHAPAPDGTLALTGGKLALAGFGQFNALEARLGVDASGVNVERIAAKSGPGTLLVTGALRRTKGSGGSGFGFDVQLHIGTEKLGVYAADRLLGLLSSSEDLTGSVSGEGTELTLSVRQLLMTLPQLVPKTAGPTAIDSEIVMLGQAKAPKSVAKPYPIQLTVEAPDDLRLKAADLDIRARASLVLAVRGTAEIKGGVYATSGEINAYGREARLEHANLTFGNGGQFGPASSPYLDARATEGVPPYRLFIDVSGPIDNLKIVPTTDPPLDKEKVGLLLVTGSADGVQGGPGTQSLSQGGGLVAASALGGLLSEKLKESLGPYMPLDVLTVEPNHLEAGKHLTKRLYVGAIENLGVTDPRVNGAEIHANYKLTEHWGLDSRYGTAQAGDLDLKWSRSW